MRCRAAPGSIGSRPPAIAWDLPSNQVRQRPDIAQADLTVAASDAVIAAARARFLPSLRLTGSGGALLSTLLADPAGVGERDFLCAGVGRLRHAARVDETRHLDPRRAERQQPVDQRQLVGGFAKALFILKAVARRHLDDADARQTAHWAAITRQNGTSSFRSSSNAAGRFPAPAMALPAGAP